ncbi:MFS transporter [Sphingomonas sp. MG17]|uniref:MFS transporter n=1 Tax=Sphingomonas tagetis TaxID=2949092 RepID=A0A9X2HH77_9SPHN|nr:MFS transporter [Sphingomonas tagetis]MCP3731131.1 MFS transporter [Sphingomonas tagetis]
MSLEMSPSGIGLVPGAAPDRAARRLSLGVSGLYLALYLHYGFFAFIPLYLKTMGATPGEIGVLLAIPLVLRLLTVAPFSAWAGKRGRVRDSIMVTALLSAALITLLLGNPEHAGRIAIILAFSIMWDQLPVLTDAYAVMAVRSRALDFGRMRVWGAIGVVASTAAAGWAFGVIGIESLPWLVALLLLLPAAVAPLLPSDRQMATVEAGVTGKWRDVIADRKLMRAMIAAAMIMGSHGVLTSFGAIQWSAQGISTGMIGLLQALAVSAEILAFWFGSKLLGRRDPSLLICIAAAAAALRWLVMASDPVIGILFAAQLLHGITSTGAILGTMLVIAARVPVQTSAAAQGLNAVLLGVALAVTTAGSGLLWSHGVAPAYLAMAVLAALGVAFAWPAKTPDSIEQPQQPLSASGVEA